LSSVDVKFQIFLNFIHYKNLGCTKRTNKRQTRTKRQFMNILKKNMEKHMWEMPIIYAFSHDDGLNTK